MTDRGRAVKLSFVIFIDRALDSYPVNDIAGYFIIFNCHSRAQGVISIAAGAVVTIF